MTADATLLAPALSPAAEARRIAREVAAPHADAVDRDARFPAEAVAALRASGLLGAAVPGPQGPGCGIAALAGACFELGQACGSTAMVFAMHQIQVASLLHHGGPWHRDYLARLARDGLLLASATTEAGTGGDVRSSDCAVRDADGMVAVEKAGCVISYAAEADGVLVTARRAPDAHPADQVLLLAERAQCTLRRTAGWDVLGMRGTCSEGYTLAVRAPAAQLLPVPYATISARSMLPVSHILWSATWLGIATAATLRARAAVRARARATSPGTPPHGGARLAEALGQLQAMRALVGDAVRRHERAAGDEAMLESIPFVLAMNQLKTTASTLAVQVVGQCMLVAGLAAYRNDTPFSLGRHLRDAHSAALMIGNDRILGNCAGLLAAYRAEEPLFP